MERGDCASYQDKVYHGASRYSQSKALANGSLIIKILNMFIKRLDKYRYDVFLGDRWDNWTRVHRFHWGVKVVAGNRLPRSVIHDLNERLVK